MRSVFVSRFLFLTLATTLLVGAGCGPTLVSQPIAEPLGSAETRPLAQHEGFGTIPSPPSPIIRPGTNGSVRIQAEFPNLPPTVAVLRIKEGRPNAPELRNIAAALGIPGSMFGSNPESRQLTLEWKDADGFRWNYDADGRRVEFTAATATPKTLTVSAWPDKQAAFEAALTFLTSKGVDLRRLGVPYFDPDWTGWWEGQKNAGRCMDAATVALIRSFAATAPKTLRPPTLPFATETVCTTPEFPARLSVTFNATQDTQTILSGDGTPYTGAALVLDAATLDILSGSFLVTRDPLRSDYPSLTLEEARTRMASGGQGGTPNGDVVIASILFEWFQIENMETPRTRFLYPALVGRGTITYRDETTGPYTIVVPLLNKQDE